MTDFDKQFLLKYIALVKKNQDTLTLNILLNSTRRISEKSKDMFFTFLESFSTKLLNEYIEMQSGGILNSDAYRYIEDIQEEQEVSGFEEAKEKSLQGIMYDLCVYVFEDVLVYVLLNPSKNGNDLMNYIMTNDIEKVVDRLYSDSEYATQVIRYYTKYLVAKSNLLITDKQEEEIWNKYPIITKLFENKGYTTLNDVARDTLNDIYTDTNKIYGDSDEEKVHYMFDSFFRTNHLDHYLEQNNFDISDKQAVRRFKYYMIRVILADAYLNLKIAEMDYPEEEKKDISEILTPNEVKALSFIEECATQNRYKLPKNSEVRSIIYEHFIYYNMYYEIKNDLSFLEDEEDMKKVLKINPLALYD